MGAREYVHLTTELVFVGGDPHRLLGPTYVAGVLVGLGVWTRRRTPFEVAYLTAWYLGPTNGLAPLDYVGARPGAVAVGVPFLYLGLAVLALGAAVVGRGRA